MSISESVVGSTPTRGNYLLFSINEIFGSKRGVEFRYSTLNASKILPNYFCNFNILLHDNHILVPLAHAEMCDGYGFECLKDNFINI